MSKRNRDRRERDAELVGKYLRDGGEKPRMSAARFNRAVACLTAKNLAAANAKVQRPVRAEIQPGPALTGV